MSLLAWYRLEGNGLDSSGNARHASIVGAPATVPGKIGSALSFAGAGYLYCDVDAVIRTLTDITISGWYYHNASHNGAPWEILTNTAPISSADGFWWHIDYINTYFYLRTEDSVTGERGYTGTPFVVDGVWYHLATVIGENKFKVYVNGSLYTNWEPTFSWGNINADTLFLNIGKSYNLSINGIVDEIKVWDDELSPKEINFLINNSYTQKQINIR